MLNAIGAISDQDQQGSQSEQLRSLECFKAELKNFPKHQICCRNNILSPAINARVWLDSHLRQNAFR